MEIIYLIMAVIAVLGISYGEVSCDYLTGIGTFLNKKYSYMRRIITLTSILIFMSLGGSTQTVPKPLLEVASGWERIYIKDVGNFDLPPTMEVQSKKYRTDLINKLHYYDTPQLVAQPNSTNDYKKEGLSKYARVIIETIKGSQGEYEKLNFNIADYTQPDIAEMNDEFKQTCRRNLQQINMHIVEWFPLKIEKINNMSCLHVSYIRQLKNNPQVLVHMYYFHNYDRMHVLSLSYRLSETILWESDLTNVLNSFRITTIKE